MRTTLIALAAALLCGCDAYHLMAGRLQESRRRFPEALAHYEAFAARRPADERAAEARVRAGLLYAALDRCLEARRSFEAAARDFPKVEPWAARAKAGVMSCPDYFPLAPGRSWVYGDSASGGKAMRLEWRVRTSSGAGGVVAHTLYAGSKKYQEGETRFEVSDWTIWQRDKDGRFPLLIFPYDKGRGWTARRGGKRYAYRIEADDAEVKTAAGAFTRCLKVRETDEEYKEAWKYEYYCPSVGRALTTVAGDGFENPNTELLSFEN